MISIIVPIYNKKNLVRRCIESLLNQKNVELEIIIVDDGSTDNSLEVCKKIENECENVTVISQKNAGVSSARNNGLKHANGEWISFVDPDDYVESTLYYELLSGSDGCDIVSCCCYAVDGHRQIINHFFRSDCVFDEDNKIELYCQLLDGNYGQPGVAFTAIGVPWGKIYRRSLLMNNGFSFNLKLKRQQDNIFNMHAFAAAKRIRYIDKPLYYYTLDNIKNYYRSKYNNYAAENAIEFQRERYEFFLKDGISFSNELKRLYDNEVICNLIGVLNKDILNRKNPQSYKEKKTAYYRMVNNEYVNKSLRQIDVNNVNGLFHKSIFWATTRNMYPIIYLIWKSRFIYEYFKFERNSK